MNDLFARLLIALQSWRARRDELLWHEWESFLQDRARGGGRIFEVKKIRQYAQTGTKAFAADLGSQEVEPIWVERSHLRTRTYILATDMFRRDKAGSHHDEDFLHIRYVVRTVDHRVFSGWTRHNQRRQPISR